MDPTTDPVAARPVDWRTAPLAALIAHLVDRHHAFTREILARIDGLLPQVCAAHGERHPELHAVATIYGELRDELGPHLLKEEHVLFPFVTVLEDAAATGRAPRRPPFGTVANPARMMDHEHVTALQALDDLRKVTGGLAVPDDACATYRALFDALDAFDRDLRVHIDLETNVLFPRAVELERSLG